jgi:ergothioneine biosynthesis protein EgtB
LLARPTVEEVYAYREYVDAHMLTLLDKLEHTPNAEISSFIELGLNHEQQHQELLLMDIKHNFFVNPLKPEYRTDLKKRAGEAPAIQWFEQEAGLYEVGHASESGFAYDNESPRHKHYLHDFKLANRLVTNAEYLAFIEDGGYKKPELWLAEGWHHINNKQAQHPLYWQPNTSLYKEGINWMEFTLGGMQALDPHQPVCHVNYYEADAYARWAGKRLPTEFEIEVVLAQQPLQGNFVDDDYLHPQVADANGQWFGELWTWTSTAYHAYPGFKPLAGSAGEYNGKFMCKQMILRGGACVTSHNHMRATYRNFFYPHDRWQFSGIRLCE